MTYTLAYHDMATITAIKVAVEDPDDSDNFLGQMWRFLYLAKLN